MSGGSIRVGSDDLE